MDLIEYWWEHLAELVFGPKEQEEERERRVQEWHEHLWDTL